MTRRHKIINASEIKDVAYVFLQKKLNQVFIQFVGKVIYLYLDIATISITEFRFLMICQIKSYLYLQLHTVNISGLELRVL